MISGTEKEIAALALARSKAVWHQQIGSYGGRKGTGEAVKKAANNLKLAERRELVRAGKLPGSSTLPHEVKLGVDLVELLKEVSWNPMAGEGPPHRMPGAYLTTPVGRALNDTVTGAHELWFNDEGEAFLSFADEVCAAMFVLALEGDRS